MDQRSPNPLLNPLPPREELPRVTVLCGFLGAGKTTTLKHLLAQAEGRRWAAVVNDLAAINIDGSVVSQQFPGAGTVVELGNGCVCCSGGDDLAEVIVRLSVEGDFEHILVETTGVADPRGIATLFTRKNPFGPTLAERATLSALVSVVDAPHFLGEWRKQRGPSPVDPERTDGGKAVFELMVEQVETADVILLNKSDLVTAEELAELEQIVSALNLRAELLAIEQGQVMSEWLLDRVRFEPGKTVAGAAWIEALNAVAPAENNTDRATRVPVVARVSRHGITSFVYQARRPFVREKLEAVLSKPWPGLLRAKGFYWTREQPDEMGFLSLAGGIVRYETLNYWWAAMIENGRARREDRPPMILALWQEPHGDRRQELVFLGVGLDEAALKAELDSALVK